MVTGRSFGSETTPSKRDQSDDESDAATLGGVNASLRAKAAPGPHQAPPDGGGKAAYVRDMFAAIAPRYDLVNRLMTARSDERWRLRAISALSPPHGACILDACCGTGDLAFRLVESDPTLRVTGADFCEPMLAQARLRAAHRARLRRHQTTGRIDFVRADVMSLPYEDRRFDGAVMGFAMRNVVDIHGTLRELRRVLRPGARFVNLDVSKAPNRVFKGIFDFYFYGIVPVLGGLIGGSPAAYRYLPQSLTNFPDAEELNEYFDAAGFTDVRFQRLAGGAIALHVGTA